MTKNYEMNKERMEMLVEERGNDLVWYMLRYDIVTGEYNNDIVFKNYVEALEEYNNSNSRYDNEVVELMFAPMSDDKEYFDNELVLRKAFDLTRPINCFNGMTVEDAMDEINSWDFYETFGDDAERLSDAIKRIQLLVDELYNRNSSLRKSVEIEEM